MPFTQIFLHSLLINSTAQFFPCSRCAACQQKAGSILFPHLCSPTPQHNSFHALGWLHVSKGLGPFYAHNCARQRHSTILSMFSVRQHTNKGLAAFYTHNCARQRHSTILSILSVGCMLAKGWDHFMPIIVLANAIAQFFPCSRCAAC